MIETQLPINVSYNEPKDSPATSLSGMYDHASQGLEVIMSWYEIVVLTLLTYFSLSTIILCWPRTLSGATIPIDHVLLFPGIIAFAAVCQTTLILRLKPGPVHAVIISYHRDNFPPAEEEDDHASGDVRGSCECERVRPSFPLILRSTRATKTF